MSWDDDGADTTPCPHCGEEVYENAERCPHCERYLVGVEGTDWDDDQDDTTSCPYCGESIYDDTERCPHCERYLSREDESTEADSTARKPSWLVGVVVVAIVVALMWAMRG
jgi:hypothetical protein